LESTEEKPRAGFIIVDTRSRLLRLPHERFSFFSSAHSGLIAGVVSIFTGWLWMGAIFHRFQKLTPQTWRRESAQSYALSSIVHIFAALGIALLFSVVAHDQNTFFQAGVGGGAKFALVCWGLFALLIVLEAAIYINLHPFVVVGQLLDWLSTSLLACVIRGWWLGR
jgi:hypothetical protein